MHALNLLTKTLTDFVKRQMRFLHASFQIGTLQNYRFLFIIFHRKRHSGNCTSFVGVIYFLRDSSNKADSLCFRGKVNEKCQPCVFSGSQKLQNKIHRR